MSRDVPVCNAYSIGLSNVGHDNIVDKIIDVGLTVSSAAQTYLEAQEPPVTCFDDPLADHIELYRLSTQTNITNTIQDEDSIFNRSGGIAGPVVSKATTSHSKKKKKQADCGTR